MLDASPVPRSSAIVPLVVVGCHVIVKTVPRELDLCFLKRNLFGSWITCLNNLSSSRSANRLWGQLACESFEDELTYIVLCQNGWRGDKERQSDNSKWLETGKHYDWMGEGKTKKEISKMSLSERQENLRTGGCGREIYELEWRGGRKQRKKDCVCARVKNRNFQGWPRWLPSFPHPSRNSILQRENYTTVLPASPLEKARLHLFST